MKYTKIEESSLQVAPAYQRTINKCRVSYIIKNFDADAFGSLVVGQRADGTLWVVDGFQRLTAARQMGMSRVPCGVFESDGQSHEARMFRHYNSDRTIMSAVNSFRASIAEGDHQSLAILAAVENAGMKLQLNQGRNTHGWPGLCCVGALTNIYDRGGAQHLTQVLNVVGKCWNRENDATRGTILDGLSAFIIKCVSVDEKRLIRKLKTIEPMAIIRFADSQNRLMGGSRIIAVASAFLNFYNKGARSKVAFRGQ